MAIHIEANYSKKIGLPQFSSHQFSVTIKTELSDVSQVQSESDRLYHLLQQSVNASIQQVGFLPANQPSNGNGNGHNGGNGGNGNGHDTWECSLKQRDLILKIVEENKLDKKEIEALAQDRFSKSVKQLNKLEASGLIEKLLEKVGAKNGHNRFKKGVPK